MSPCSSPAYQHQSHCRQLSPHCLRWLLLWFHQGDFRRPARLTRTGVGDLCLGKGVSFSFFFFSCKDMAHLKVFKQWKIFFSASQSQLDCKEFVVSSEKIAPLILFFPLWPERVIWLSFVMQLPTVKLGDKFTWRTEGATFSTVSPYFIGGQC